MTALQVREHADLTPDQLVAALHEAAPRGAGRTQRAPRRRCAARPTTRAPRARAGWTFGYLFDVIHTRDPWIHRVDICRAIGRELELTAEHDGRIVADVVADWARRHGSRSRSP